MLALWQLGRYCVTALLTMLPYNSFQSSCANRNLYLNLIYQHADGLKTTKLITANSWYATIQIKSIILHYIRYLLSNILLFSVVLQLDHELPTFI